MWQLKTAVFLHWCLIFVVPFLLIFFITTLLFQFVPVVAGVVCVVATAILAKILLGNANKKKKNPVALVGKVAFTRAFVLCI
jgi:hypothetical protein